jgi:hypothetical protein
VGECRGIANTVLLQWCEVLLERSCRGVFMVDMD